MGSIDSYNFLMMVNAVQEQSIKELFKRKRWTCLYKVLPPSCSYLWGLYDDEDTSRDAGPVPNESHPRKSSEGTSDYDTVGNIDKDTRNVTPNLMGKDNTCRPVSVDVKNTLSCRENDVKTIQGKQTDWLKVTMKENTQEKVDEYEQDLLVDSESSDTDDYDADSLSVTDTFKCAELTKAKEVHEKGDSTERIDKACLKTKHDNIDCINTARKVKSKIEVHFDSNLSKRVPLNASVIKFKRGSAVDKKNISDHRKIHVSKQRNFLNGKLKTVKDSESEENTSACGYSIKGQCKHCGQSLNSKNPKIKCSVCRDQCTVCEKTFSKTPIGQKRLTSHLSTHTGNRLYECDKCQATFPLEAYLYEHKEKRHSRELELIPCEICKKSVKKSSLKNHMRNMHSEDTTTFQCDICGNVFRYKGSLEQHIISVHAKQRNFICDICSSTFTSAHNLRLHRIRHNADHKVVCNICGKTLHGGSGFVEHMRRHANQRKYECGKCPKSFYNKRELVNHYKIHTGERPYKCHLCPYACAIKGNLTKHMKKHRTGDVIPNHNYMGHCELENISRNIEKIEYKESNTKTDGSDVETFEKNTKDNDVNEVNQSGQQDAYLDSGHVSDSKNENVRRADADVVSSEVNMFVTDDRQTNFAVLNNPEYTTVAISSSDLNSQEIGPVTTLNDINYSLPVSLPIVHRGNQSLNPEQTDRIYNNTSQYYA